MTTIRTAIHNIEARRGNIRELTTAEIVLELEAEITKEEPEGVTANYMQVRDLTDDEWMSLPKEEVIQLYKNCYEMLNKLIPFGVNQEPEGVTADDMLKPYADLAENIALTPGIYVIEMSDAVGAMEAYARTKQPGLREIDMPTDVEIKEQADLKFDLRGDKAFYWIGGVKWMRDEILKRNLKQSKSK